MSSHTPEAAVTCARIADAVAHGLKQRMEVEIDAAWPASVSWVTFGRPKQRHESHNGALLVFSVNGEPWKVRISPWRMDPNANGGLGELGWSYGSRERQHPFFHDVAFGYVNGYPVRDILLYSLRQAWRRVTRKKQTP